MSFAIREREVRRVASSRQRLNKRYSRVSEHKRVLPVQHPFWRQIPSEWKALLNVGRTHYGLQPHGASSVDAIAQEHGVFELRWMSLGLWDFISLSQKLDIIATVILLNDRRSQKVRVLQQNDIFTPWMAAMRAQREMPMPEKAMEAMVEHYPWVRKFP